MLTKLEAIDKSSICGLWLLLSLSRDRVSTLFSYQQFAEEVARIYSGVMEEHEFQRLLHLFPVVRTRDYCADAESSAQSASRSPGNELKEWQDAWGEQETRTQDDFWDKLKSAAEKKVGPAEAKRFCNAFQKIYHKLVHEELSREAIESFLNSS